MGHIPEASESTIRIDESQEIQEIGDLPNEGLMEAARLRMQKRREAKRALRGPGRWVDEGCGSTLTMKQV